MDKLQQLESLLTDPFRSFTGLTDGERDALKWASRGYSYSDISDIMGISKEMANYHLRNGLMKVGKKKRELVTYVFDTMFSILND